LGSRPKAEINYNGKSLSITGHNNELNRLYKKLTKEKIIDLYPSMISWIRNNSKTHTSV
jgi:hypothetical protein